MFSVVNSLSFLAMRRGPGERAQFMRERLAREKKGEKHSSSSEDDDDIYCQDENEDISDQEDDDGGSSSEEDGEEGDRTPRVSKNTVLVKKGIPRPQGPSNRSGSPVVIDLDDGPASKPEGEKVKGSGSGGTVVVNLDNGSGSKPEGVKTKASGGGMVVVNLGKPAEAKPKPAGTVVVNLGQENKTPQPPSARKGLVVNLGGETVDEVQASSISVASAPASSIMSDSVSVVDLEGDRPPVEEHRTVVAELLAPLAPTTPEVISVSVISTSQSSLSLDLGQLPPEDLFDQDTYG